MERVIRFAFIWLLLFVSLLLISAACSSSSSVDKDLKEFGEKYDYVSKALQTPNAALDGVTEGQIKMACEHVQRGYVIEPQDYQPMVALISDLVLYHDDTVDQMLAERMKIDQRIVAENGC